MSVNLSIVISQGTGIHNTALCKVIGGFSIGITRDTLRSEAKVELCV